MKKPRSDSPLQNLPEEQAAKLCDWMLSGLPYHKVKKLVKDQFDLETSEAALSRFYSSYCAAALLVRRSRAVTTAAEIAEEASKTPGQFDTATIDALKQKAFELSISPQSDPSDVKDLFMLVLKAKDQDLKDKDIEIKMRRLEILEKREQQAKEVVTNEQLTPQQRQEKMREIFGISK